ncbi:MAG: hypothetical protein AABZ54_00470 [Bacteroidota bacterium]
MRKNLLPIIVISIMIGFYIPAFAKDSSDFFANAFLVRDPYFVDSCGAKTDANAVLIIREQKIFEKTDIVYIITHSQGIIEATVTRILNGCEPFVEEDLALLYAPKKIEWLPGIDALIAIKGKKLSEGKIGIVKQYTLGEKERLFLIEIKKYLPKDDHVAIDNVLKFVLPDTKNEYIFIGISHFDPATYKNAGDKVLKNKGFIFSIKQGIPVLVLEEDDLTNIFTVSKLANNRVYEILVHSSTVYQGSYELRFFDGQKFLKDKIFLYQWMD